MTKQKTQQSKYSQLSDAEKFRIVRHAERYRIKKKLFAIAYKGGKCQKCGYDKCIGALDFHHLDPSIKEYGWTQMRKLSIPNMIKELDKCILVCATCHREIHYTQTPEFLQDIIEELKQPNDPFNEILKLNGCAYE
jgi:hypothetical protein